MKKTICSSVVTLVLSQMISMPVMAYDARISGTEILTPEPADKPRINGPRVYGARPEKPLIYRIPTTGLRPIQFEIKNLPESLILDANTGIIRGTTPKKRGAYPLQINAANTAGKDSFTFTLVVGDKLALTPPMGWNHWYTHYLYITDELIRKAADSMVESGMADVGYQYVSIDDCWMRMDPAVLEDRLKNAKPFWKKRLDRLDRDKKVGRVRDDEGNILSAGDFPDMKGLTDYIHAYGLKAGIYSSPGPRTCQAFEGSFNSEARDARQYADWGFDLLKYDWCSYGQRWKQYVDNETLGPRYPYELMGGILKKLDRDIVLNICQYGRHDVWTWGADVGGQSWRIGGDLGWEMSKDGIFNAAKKALKIGEFNKPGAWNDLDYLIMGMWTHPSDMGGKLVKVSLTPNQHYTYFSLWTMIATPLFFSGDMGSVDDFLRGILCNPEIIAVNQDPLGRCAEILRMTDEEWILKKTLEDGSFVYGFFNLTEADRTIEANGGDLAGQMARDLWRQRDIGKVTDSRSFDVQVGPLGCAMIHFAAE